MPDLTSKEQITSSLRETTPKKEVREKKASLKEALLRACFGRNHGIPNSITSIDLGEIGKDMEIMMAETESDDRRRERGKSVYVKRGIFFGGHKIRWENKHRIGGENSFRTKRHVYTEKVERPASTPHSHPADVPPSPLDAVRLFSDSPHDEPSVMVITPKRKILVVRGENAMTVSPEEAKRIKDEWEKKIEDDRIIIFGPNGSDSQKRRLETQLQDGHLAAYAKKYGWRIFECPKNENVVKLK